MRIFLTTLLPEHLIGKHNLSFAACNFSRNLMSGGGFDKTYSILPLFVQGEVEPEAYQDQGYDLIYAKNLRKLGRKLTLLACMVEQWRQFCKIPHGAKVWTYNLTTLSVLTVLLLKLFKPSVQVNVIVLDFTPVQKGLGLNSLFLKFINAAHGNICLAHSDLFTCKNRVILPGVVPAQCGEEPRITAPNRKFLLSGALNEVIAQVSMVLKVFAQLPNCELHITGTPEDEALIRKYAEQYPHIIYHGKLSFQAYLDLMHSCTYQLSTRDSRYPENQCNFPSKVIEALLHNRIVVSTINYPQLEGIQYLQVDSDETGFFQNIQRIVEMSDQDLMPYANQGKHVAELFSTEVWNQCMSQIEAAKTN